MTDITGLGGLVRTMITELGQTLTDVSGQTLAASLDEKPLTALEIGANPESMTLNELKEHAERLTALINSSEYIDLDPQNFDHLTDNADPLLDPVMALAETSRLISEHHDNPSRSTSATEPEPPILFPEPPTLMPDDTAFSL